MQKTRDRETLLGYLLGALEDVQREEIESRLCEERELRIELEQLREALAPLESLKQEVRPPADLAARTCDFVFRRAALPSCRNARQKAARPSVFAPFNVRRADVLVAAALLVAAVCVLFPAIRSSRFRVQLLACQDNLREIGVALSRFSNSHDGYFPTVPTKGKLAVAGIYASKLASDKLLTETRRLCCPGSSLKALEVPCLADLEKASTQQLNQLLPTLGGSYGYTLGHLVDGVYHDTKNLHRASFALVADLPSESSPNRQSIYHDGRGENVLFEDNHVQFIAQSRPMELADDIYSNDLGDIGAGAHADDSVIVPSATSPLDSVSLH